MPAAGNNLKQIGSLRQTLLEIGYTPSQVAEMIAEITGRKKLDSCGETALQAVAVALEAQIEFAKRCQKALFADES